MPLNLPLLSCNLLDLEQVVLMIYLGLTPLAEVEVRTEETLVPNTDDGIGQAAVTLDPFMN
jgi:hypothetical protein